MTQISDFLSNQKNKSVEVLLDDKALYLLDGSIYYDQSLYGGTQEEAKNNLLDSLKKIDMDETLQTKVSFFKKNKLKKTLESITVSEIDTHNLLTNNIFNEKKEVSDNSFVLPDLNDLLVDENTEDAESLFESFGSNIKDEIEAIKNNSSSEKDIKFAPKETAEETKSIDLDAPLPDIYDSTTNFVIDENENVFNTVNHQEVNIEKEFMNDKELQEKAQKFFDKHAEIIELQGEYMELVLDSAKNEGTSLSGLLENDDETVNNHDELALQAQEKFNILEAKEKEFFDISKELVNETNNELVGEYIDMFEYVAYVSPEESQEINKSIEEELRKVEFFELAGIDVSELDEEEQMAIELKTYNEIVESLGFDPNENTK